MNKGSLRCQSRPGLAGLTLTVLDENNKLVPDARVYAAGHEYAPDKSGRFLLPYSTAGGDGVPAVLSRGDLATLTQIPHPTENYNLSASFFVDRQALIEGRTAWLLVRTRLSLADREVTSACWRM